MITPTSHRVAPLTLTVPRQGGRPILPGLVRKTARPGDPRHLPPGMWYSGDRRPVRLGLCQIRTSDSECRVKERRRKVSRGQAVQQQTRNCVRCDRKIPREAIISRNGMRAVCNPTRQINYWPVFRLFFARGIGLLKFKIIQTYIST